MAHFETFVFQNSVVSGINQDDEVVQWPPDGRVYSPSENKTSVTTDDWWWRFKWFWYPELEVGPYVWVWYADGTLDSRLCSNPNISWFANEATCVFDAPPPPILGADCSDPGIYPGILHCTKDSYIEIIKVNTKFTRFETVLAQGYDRYGNLGECRDVNTPNWSIGGPGCTEVAGGTTYPFQTVEEMIGRYPHAVVAFNADLFGHTDHGHGPEGLTVKNGDRFDGIYGDTDGNDLNRPSLSITKDGRIRMGWVTHPEPSSTWMPDETEFWNTVGATNMLVEDSQVVVEEVCSQQNSTCPFRDKKRGRIAIGKTKVNELIIVAVPDIGTIEYEDPKELTLDELAVVMKQLGAFEAINLDGGGSTQLWYRPDSYLVSPGRQVADALLIFPEPPVGYGPSQTIHIYPGETKKFFVQIPLHQAVAMASTTWPGSDVIMTLKSPSNRSIDRNTSAVDVAHDVGSTFESYTIINPDAGNWEVSLYGADVAPEGEDVTFTLTTGGEASIPQLAYIDGDLLVLNMGSVERRTARNIEPDTIDEDFQVFQLDTDKFAVTAFGLTQVFQGATQIQADGDDGNDIVKLQPGEVPFVAPANIKGGSGDDLIQSGDGVDALSGGDGNDVINSGAGNDVVSGDSGNDELNGQGGEDVINGGADNDTISGGTDADVLHGDDGDDNIRGEDGADSIYGDSGADSLYGGTGDDSINGGPDNDMMEGNDGADTMHGNDGNDQMYGQADADSMFGDAGDDVMDGGAGADMMEGNDAADTMHGGTENDKLYGNVGPDQMYGDAGKDTILGHTGNDELHGGVDDDYMEGNEDTDTMFGDDGQDDMLGGSPVSNTSDGADTMSGGSDHDVLIGDNGTITRPGGLNPYNNSVIRAVVLFDVQVAATSINTDVAGNDIMNGDDGDDLMFGQGGDDQLSGGADHDYQEGNAGADIVSGDAGPDDIIGGSSANDGVIDAARRGYGLADMGDELHGGDQGDVIAGDNARILRPVDGDNQWLIDPNTGEPVRQVVLFDIEIAGPNLINQLTSGPDRMFGDAGTDKMFGQGNGPASDNAGSDPVDSIDNDRNGREAGGTVGAFDCLDGRDNDNDRLIDTADPQCATAIDNNPGGDEMHGGSDYDYMEGNTGSDWMFGDEGEDDIIGGSSAGDGVIGSPVMPTNLKDDHDVINGNDEDDVLVGDNAQVLRPVDSNGFFKRLVGGVFDLAIRDVRLSPTVERTGAFGNDWISGGAGTDDMYGQLGNDYMEGNAGEDAMVGDLGKITNNIMGVNDGIADPDTEQRIAPQAPFFDPGELIYQNGSLYRQVELYFFLSRQGGAGDDTLHGGEDNDAIHGGAGKDIMNGNAGDDRLFGGDDSDAMWGGIGHDILFGGYGEDYLDVLPRSSQIIRKIQFPSDPATWFEATRVDNYQDLDIMYGGWDRDWMQADVSAPGRNNGDRMIDWAGAFNAYYRCDAAYGEWSITRQHSPSVVEFLQQLSQGFGAVNTNTSGTSGFQETAIVFSTEIRFNSNPPNPDNPAHFTCGPAR